MEPKQLTAQEEIEYRDGLALQEMVETAGFQVLSRWLESRLKTHADPRDCASEEEWKFRELNAFWSGKMAEEMMENILQAISRSDYLGKVKSGELQRHRMEIK